MFFYRSVVKEQERVRGTLKLSEPTINCLSGLDNRTQIFKQMPMIRALLFLSNIRKSWTLPAAHFWLQIHLLVPILPPHSQMSPATLPNFPLASHSLGWASNGQGKQTRNYHLEQTSDYLSSNHNDNRTQERAAAYFAAFVPGSDCYGMRWPFHLAMDHRARWCQVAWTVGKKLEHLWPTPFSLQWVSSNL